MTDMRDPERIARILARFREVWEKNPDLRFLQLVENICLVGGNIAPTEEGHPCYRGIEDEDFDKWLYSLV